MRGSKKGGPTAYLPMKEGQDKIRTYDNFSTINLFSGEDGNRTRHKILAKDFRPLGTCLPRLFIN